MAKAEELFLWSAACAADYDAPVRGKRETTLKLFTLAATRQEAEELFHQGAWAIPNIIRITIEPVKVRRTPVDSGTDLVERIGSLWAQGYRPVVPYERLRTSDTALLFLVLWGQAQV